MLWNKRNLPHRILSGFLALMYVLVSVLSPIGVLPVFATQDIVSTSYQYKEKEEIEIYMVSETGTFVKGETVSIRLFIENNSEETLTEGCLSWDDIHDNFSEAGFVPSEEYENVGISEKGYLTNVTLAPGEVLEIEFHGTLEDDREAIRNEKIVFKFYAKNSTELISKRVEFNYTRNLIDFFGVTFPEGNKSAAGETNTMELRLTLNDVKHWITSGNDTEENIATDSNSDEQNTEVETKLIIATDSDADEIVATDSDADNEQEIYEQEELLVSNIKYALTTYGVQLEDVTIKSVNSSDEEIIAQVEYKTNQEAIPGQYFGSVDAVMKVNGKTYEASQGFEIAVEQGLSEEELAEVQKVIDMINQLPSLEEMMETVMAYMEAGEEDEYNEYAQKIARIAQPAYEAYMALNDAQKALVVNIDILLESASIWSAVSLAEESYTVYNPELRPEVITNKINSDIDINLFNYGGGIHEIYDNMGECEKHPNQGFGLVGGNSSTNSWTIDGYNWDTGCTCGRRLSSTLTNEYPYPAYYEDPNALFDSNRLFDPELDDVGYTYEDYLDEIETTKYVHLPVYTSQEGQEITSDYTRISVPINGDGGLFQRDSEGYLYYDSNLNAASYDYNSHSFKLYKHKIVPSYIIGAAQINGNFFPFNDAENVNQESAFVGMENENGPWKNTDQNNLYGDQEDHMESTLPYQLNEPTDTWFGMTMKFDFYMPKNGEMQNGNPMTFEFAGDDDVWVYIDDVLVLDIGGTHSPLRATINFSDGTVQNPNENKGKGNNIVDESDNALTNLRDIFEAAGVSTEEFNSSSNTFKDYTKHTLKFFYLESGANRSYCKLKFNMPTLPEGSLLVGKDLKYVDANGNAVDEANLTQEEREVVNNIEYTFAVVDDEGNAVKANEAVPMVGADGNKILNADGSLKMVAINRDGEFTLKAGEKVLFEELEAAKIYYVEERLSVDALGQYEGVWLKQTELNGIENDKNVIYKSTELQGDTSHVAIYTNRLNVDAMSELIIGKEIVDGSHAHGQKFYFEVKIDDEPIPEGTVFNLENPNGTVTSEKREFEGVKKVVVGLSEGQKATMVIPLIVGTKYSVEEVGTADWKLTHYDHCEEEPIKDEVTGKFVTDDNGNIQTSPITSTKTDSSVVGTVDAYSSYTVTAFNRKCTANIELKKIVTGNMGDREKQFKFNVLVEPVNGESYSKDVSLKHDGTETIKVPMDSVVTITELDNDGYKVESTVKCKNMKESLDVDSSNTVVKFTVGNSDGYDVEFINNKEAIIDTGITLDSLPYILILGAVIAGVVVFVFRKRKDNDFE